MGCGDKNATIQPSEKGNGVSASEKGSLEKPKNSDQSSMKEQTNISQSNEQSYFLSLISDYNSELDEAILEDRMKAPNERLERWRKSPNKDLSGSAPKITVPDNEKLLNELSLRLSEMLGETPVLLKSSATFVVTLSDKELKEIKSWDRFEINKNSDLTRD